MTLEALWINTIKPDLNTKDEYKSRIRLLYSSFVFKSGFIVFIHNASSVMRVVTYREVVRILTSSKEILTLHLETYFLFVLHPLLQFQVIL